MDLDLRFDDEKQLANGLKILEKWGCGFKRYKVLEEVQIYVTTNNLKTCFKNNKPVEVKTLHLSTEIDYL